MVTAYQLRQYMMQHVPPLPNPADHLAQYDRYCVLDALAYALSSQPDDGAPGPLPRGK